MAPLAILDEDVAVNESHYFFEYHNLHRILLLIFCFSEDYPAQLKQGQVLVHFEELSHTELYIIV